MRYARRHTLLPWLIVLCTLPALASGESESPSFRQRASDKLTALTDPDEEDIRTEIGFGREVAAHLLGKYPRVTDDSLQRYVNLVGKHLAQYCTRPELEFRFVVVESTAANTYSAPGGYVFVTSGTLSQLEDEAELAAVLAHEIAHISEKHVIRELRMAHSSGKSAEKTLARILGNTGKTSDWAAVNEALRILLETGFPAEDELAADQLALQILSNSGYDPLALRRHLSRLANNRGRLTRLDALIAGEHLDKLDYARGTARFTRMTQRPVENQ